MAIERAGSATAEHSETAQAMFARMTRIGGSLPVMYGTAGRLYGHLLAVCAMTVVPACLLWEAVVVALGGRFAIFNGSLRLVGASAGALALLAVTMLVLPFAGLVCLAAGSRVVLDFVEGRPVSAARAVRRLVVRPHAVVLLAVQFGGAALALAAFTAWLHAASGSLAPGLILAIPGGVLLLSGLIAWAALADGVPPIRTAYDLLSRDFGGTVRRIMVGFLGVPGLVQLGLYGLGLTLPVVTGVPIADAVRMIASLLLAPFQAATLACCYAHLRLSPPRARPVRPASAADADVTAHEGEALPPHNGGAETIGPEPLRVTPRSRWWWPLGAVLLPGLLYGGFVAANPLKLVNVIDYEIGVPHHRDLVATQITFGPGGVPVVLRAEGLPQVTFCDGPTCASHTTTILEEFFGVPPAATMTADGRMIIAGWVYKGRRADLEMFACRPSGCVRRAGEPLRVADADHPLSIHSAAVTTPDGIAVVSVASAPDEDGSSMELTLCRDAMCWSPRRIPLGGGLSDWPGVSADSRPLAITLSPDGRPVIAFVDRAPVKIRLAVCDSPACADPAIHTYDPPRSVSAPLGFDWVHGSLRIQVATTPDGRPFVVYNDLDDDSTRILFCPDRICSRAPRGVSVREVGAIGAPGLALDRRGRPLLAGYDPTGNGLSVLACEDDGCTRRMRIHLVQGLRDAGHLDFAVGPDRRPRLVWYGSADAGDDSAFHVLTCADPFCGRVRGEER
jgi:hypothetical protein